MTDRPAAPALQHGHRDPEANPSYESNVTIHGHANGDKPHHHPNAPSWSAIGTEYVSPTAAQRLLDAPPADWE